MEKTKLEKLLDDERILKGITDIDNGVWFYQPDKVLDYLVLSYKDCHVAYLYDFERDILVHGKAKALDDAKELAEEKIEKKLNRNYH